MTAGPAEERPAAERVRVLEFIEEALAARLAEVVDPPPPADEPSPNGKAALASLDERLRQMQERLDRAERDAADADDVLRIEAETYQTWTERMTSARRRLADWAAAVK